MRKKENREFERMNLAFPKGVKRQIKVKAAKLGLPVYQYLMQQTGIEFEDTLEREYN